MLHPSQLLHRRLSLVADDVTVAGLLMLCCVIGYVHIWQHLKRHKANLFRLRSLLLSGIFVATAFFFFGLIEVACLIDLFREFKFSHKMEWSARKNPGVWQDSNCGPLKRIFMLCPSTELAGPGSQDHLLFRKLRSLTYKILNFLFNVVFLLSKSTAKSHFII